MHAQDVADDQLAVVAARGVDDRLRFFDRLGQRLLAEDVAPGLERRTRVGPVCLRVGVDADDVRPGGLQGLVVVAEFGQSAEFRG